MKIEQALDILKNSIADYVIGEYCEKCADNKICDDRNEDCYYQQAIDIVVTAYEKEKETVDKINKLNIPVDTLIAEFERLEDLEDDLTTVYLNGVYDGKKKVEDKIKAKIEEWDMKDLTICYGGRSQGRTFQQAVRTEVKEVLQLLLEKE